VCFVPLDGLGGLGEGVRVGTGQCAGYVNSSIRRAGQDICPWVTGKCHRIDGTWRWSAQSHLVEKNVEVAYHCEFAACEHVGGEIGQEMAWRSNGLRDD
jgi:hypothetical protein